MSGWTNRGKKLILNVYFRDDTPPSDFYLALCTSATAPTADTNTLADLTQIATGNGYVDGGNVVARDMTDFDTLTEDDSADRALVQLANVDFTASGGPIPSSGSGARYAVLTDDNATVANRQVIAFWDLTSNRSVSDGQTLTLPDLELRLAE